MRRGLVISVGVAVFSICVLAEDEIKLYGEDGEYLGKVSKNKYNPESISNPYGKYGSEYSSKSVNNQYGKYGSEYSSQSATNPYTTSAPRMRGVDETADENVDLGRLSRNKYDSESSSNEYGRHGSPYSTESINNPYSRWGRASETGGYSSTTNASEKEESNNSFGYTQQRTVPTGTGYGTTYGNNRFDRSETEEKESKQSGYLGTYGTSSRRTPTYEYGTSSSSKKKTGFSSLLDDDEK